MFLKNIQNYNYPMFPLIIIGYYLKLLLWHYNYYFLYLKLTFIHSIQNLKCNYSLKCNINLILLYFT